MNAYRPPFAWLIAAAAAAAVLAPQPGIAATEVNTCGQVVSGSAYLAADLDCTGFAGDAVMLDGGTLDLQGFTLTGGLANAVTCMRNCKIASDPPGGTITGASAFGVYGGFFGSGFPNIRVSDVTIQFNGDGIFADSGNVAVTDSVISNNSGQLGIGVESTTRNVKVVRSTVTGHALVGVTGGNKTTVIDSDVSSNPGQGVSGGSIKTVIRRSTVSLNGQEGFIGGAIKVIDSTVENNGGPGVRGGDRILIAGSDLSGNGGQGVFHGLTMEPATIKNSTVSNNALEGIRDEGATNTRVLAGSIITGNGLHGIYSTNTVATPDECSQTVRDSVITGNGTDPDCGVSETCADLAACAVPNLVNVTCETSYDTLSGFPGTSWGVCSLD